MAKTTARQAISDIAKEYTFFNPKLIEDANDKGDIYDDDSKIEAMRQEWEVNTSEMPYLEHVKFLSKAWPHLRLLADFMEVSTTPARWKHLQNLHKSSKDGQAKRDERIKRTKAARLDYLDSGAVTTKNYDDAEDLRKSLFTPGFGYQAPEDTKVRLRLFVLEDLSRDVIEYFGARFDIEPAFFREHIVDYAWYHTRERGIDPPNLEIVAKQQPWIQFRFVQARYFRTKESFRKAVKEVENFNVVRRLDDDQNNNTVWDENEALTGIMRTKASFWLGRAGNSEQETIGILLLDPPIKEGYPLWRGYRNWEPTPGISIRTPPRGPPRDSIFNDFLYWSGKSSTFVSPASKNSAPRTHNLVEALLRLLCAEWLMTAEYIQTRLNQIDWEISFPEHFVRKNSSIDMALKKLHTWRRLVPLYRKMLTETVQAMESFPCHTTPHLTSNSGADGVEHGNSESSCHCAMHDANTTQPGSINALRPDFMRVLGYMKEYQQRIDRLTSVVTAVISISDSRHAIDDNRNLARLTWLATVFIPLSFVAGLFSMTEDITTLHQTIKWYFATALPLSGVVYIFALLLNLPSVLRVGRWLKSKLEL